MLILEIARRVWKSISNLFASKLERRLGVSGSAVVMSCLADVCIKSALGRADAMVEVARLATPLVKAVGIEHFDPIALACTFARF